MIFRPEEAADAEAVEALVSAAFGQPDESRLVSRLRATGEIVLSMVAVENEVVIGHVLFSKMGAPFRALALAPLSVSPSRQNCGVGSGLVRRAITWVRDGGWTAVFVLGDPAYYGRFGFDASTAAGFSCPYAGDHFMGMALKSPLPHLTGKLTHAAVFDELS